MSLWRRIQRELQHWVLADDAGHWDDETLELPPLRLPDVDLIPRERRVLIGIARGWSLKQIAQDLAVSIQTIYADRRELERKLDRDMTVDEAREIIGWPPLQRHQRRIA